MLQSDWLASVPWKSFTTTFTIFQYSCLVRERFCPPYAVSIKPQSIHFWYWRNITCLLIDQSSFFFCSHLKQICLWNPILWEQYLQFSKYSAACCCQNLVVASLFWQWWKLIFITVQRKKGAQPTKCWLRGKRRFSGSVSSFSFSHFVSQGVCFSSKAISLCSRSLCVSSFAVPHCSAASQMAFSFFQYIIYQRKQCVALLFIIINCGLGSLTCSDAFERPCLW